MTDRKRAIEQFIAATPWQGAQRVVVAGDASNRRYDRLTNSAGETAILMDAPPTKGEDIRPFVRIAKHLCAGGLSAPEIFDQDEDQGFLILEDLGDDLFARLIENAPEKETLLYEAAVDVLTHLHGMDCPDLSAYSTEIMVQMSALAYDWYLSVVSGGLNPDKSRDFTNTFKTILAPLERVAPVLIQRDYHSENLIWLPGRRGVKKVGLLDFQDAMTGHPAYDLVSVLQDARRDVSPLLETDMVARYVDQNGLDSDEFKEAYAILGLQRNLRILGVFTRLCVRDGKAHYVDLIPRVWGHILTNLKHPALNAISDVILRDLPYPDTNILNELKSKCATVPHQ